MKRINSVRFKPLEELWSIDDYFPKALCCFRDNQGLLNIVQQIRNHAASLGMALQTGVSDQESLPVADALATQLLVGYIYGNGDEL